MTILKNFEQDCNLEIKKMGDDSHFKKLSNDWVDASAGHKYTYHFEWMGRPAIQLPTDMVALQELVWEVRPDLIIEAGIAHGGSLIMNASYLAMLDYCDAVEAGEVVDPSKPKRKVLGLDIDIRAHNREAIEAHPMSHRIDMIEGPSTEQNIIDQVYTYAKDYNNIMVILDSNHTQDHVLDELEAYAPLTSKGSYCCVFDTIIEDMPEGSFPDRPWDIGDNPKTAVWAYLKKLQEKQVEASDGTRLSLEIDKKIENKIMITVAPDGFLKRV